MDRLSGCRSKSVLLLNKVRGNLETFKELVPPAASLNQIYYPEENIDWTASFWPECYF